jgi:hypothetical protein
MILRIWRRCQKGPPRKGPYMRSPYSCLPSKSYKYNKADKSGPPLLLPPITAVYKRNKGNTPGNLAVAYIPSPVDFSGPTCPPPFAPLSPPPLFFSSLRAAPLRLSPLPFSGVESPRLPFPSTIWTLIPPP